MILEKIAKTIILLSLDSTFGNIVGGRGRGQYRRERKETVQVGEGWDSVGGRGRRQCYTFTEIHVPPNKKKLKAIEILDL